MNREFLMLAKHYDFQNHVPGFWFASEKLDGERCLWDGGVTKGQRAEDVPFANTAKDYRLTSVQVSTGLWSRYGKVIHAPHWWTDSLPKKLILDGELYLGPGRFQELRRIVGCHTPMNRWDEVQYKCFDVPPPQVLYMDGKIKNPNFEKTFLGVVEKMLPLYDRDYPIMSFRSAIAFLQRTLITCRYASVVQQDMIPVGDPKGREFVLENLSRVEEYGGEGLMLRKADSWWSPSRCKELLKVVTEKTAEATVIGYWWGEQTDKGSKLLGLMGSLECQDSEGRIFNISGFADQERVLYRADGKRADEVGVQNAGLRASADIQSVLFPLGSAVTYKYKVLTKDGKPREARYWRKYLGG